MKALLDKIEADHAAEIKRIEAEAEAAERKKEQDEMRRAKEIVAGIPARVKEHLYTDNSIELCTGEEDGVGDAINCCGGLAAKIIDLLREEGLEDRVYVDIDMSGSWSSQDALRFLVRPRKT